MSQVRGKPRFRLLPFEPGQIRQRDIQYAVVGEVNLLALSEFEELKGRYEFLTTQVGDLNASLDSLQATITKINVESRKRFAETFEAVNGCFKEIFARIFPGGKGELGDNQPGPNPGRAGFSPWRDQPGPDS